MAAEHPHDIWRTVEAERLGLADLLDDLTAEQWEVASLCSAWTVRGVLAHLVTVMEPGTMRRLLREMVPARGNPHRASELAVARRVAQDTGPSLVATMRRHAGSTFAPPGLGARAPLADTLVHGLDMAVPLGITLERPVEAWRPALDFLLSRGGQAGLGRRRVPVLTYAADDVEWSHGSGPRVSGPAHALGMAISGRPALLDRLEGPGLPALRGWITV